MVIRSLQVRVVLFGLAAASGWAQERGQSRDSARDENAGVLFHETFDDAELLDRGWYDGTKFTISLRAYADSGCIEYHWKAATTNPDSSSGIRRLYKPTETVYVRYYIRLSTDAVD